MLFKSMIVYHERINNDISSSHNSELDQALSVVKHLLQRLHVDCLRVEEVPHLVTIALERQLVRQLAELHGSPRSHGLLELKVHLLHSGMEHQFGTPYHRPSEDC